MPPSLLPGRISLSLVLLLYARAVHAKCPIAGIDSFVRVNGFFADPARAKRQTIEKSLIPDGRAYGGRAVVAWKTCGNHTMAFRFRRAPVNNKFAGRRDLTVFESECGGDIELVVYTYYMGAARYQLMCFYLFVYRDRKITIRCRFCERKYYIVPYNEKCRTKVTHYCVFVHLCCGCLIRTFVQYLHL